MSACIARAIEGSTIEFLESILNEWFVEEDLMIICGWWEHGAISEIFTHGKARLVGSGYGGKFAGIRDLRVGGEKHHLHLDLSKFTAVEYTVYPCVCYNWQPSFEVRLVGEDGISTIGVSSGQPYRGKEIDIAKIKAFFHRYVTHRLRYGDFVKASSQQLSAPAEPGRESLRKVCNWLLAMTPELSDRYNFDELHPFASMQTIMDAVVEHSRIQ
jgi:hypothetical protein